ncbi:MAG: helix-turn-helix domain-containing protein [Candidatus Bathyarchaeia archaeon]
MNEIDDKKLFEILRELGLSRREAEIYLFLWKKGPQKAYTIAAYLNIDRAQTYRALNSLKEKGIVEITIEAPTRYAATPIEPLIESLIKTKKTEVARLENEKQEIINYFKSIHKKPIGQEYPIAKLKVIVGKDGIFTKILQMAKEAKKEFLELTTSSGLIHEDMAEIPDMIIKLAQEKRNIRFKILANISKENLNIIKRILKKIPARNSNIELRHIDLNSQFYPRFVMTDEEETILYVTSKSESSTPLQEDTGLWITSKMFAAPLKASFMEIWRNAVNAEDRVNELETGKPPEETTIIKEPADAQAKIKSVLDAANNEIILISSSIGINKIADSAQFKKCSERGVKIRIMAPIDLENLEAAQKLSAFCEVKHVSISYLAMMIVDNKHFFMFKTPPLEEQSLQSPFYLHNTFYTNDQKHVERAREILDAIWKRGTLISEIGSSKLAGTSIEVSSSSTILEVVDTMLKTGVNSVLVCKDNNILGVIDQKDILEKVLKAQKDPKTIIAKEIMSMPVLTINSDEPLIDALKTMREKGIPRLAVFKEGKLIAVLT